MDEFADEHRSGQITLHPVGIMGLRSASSDVLGIKEMDCLLPLRLSGGPIFPREIRLSDWSGTLKGLRGGIGRPLWGIVGKGNIRTALGGEYK